MSEELELAGRLELDAGAELEEWARQLEEERSQRRRQNDLLAEISIRLGALTRQVTRSEEAAAARHQHELAERARRIPIHNRFHTSVVFPSSDDSAVMNCGGPSQGRVWDLRSLIVGGLQWQTTFPNSSGMASIYVAGYIPTDNTPLVNLVDHSQWMPSVAHYDGHQVMVKAGECLFVRIRFGTAGATYTAQGSFLDYPVDCIPII